MNATLAGGTKYPGVYTSAIARAKRVLLEAGFPWSKKVGRYQPFFNTQTVTRGVTVTRIGVSTSVALHSRGYDSIGARGERDSGWVHALAVATLREAGLPFDDRGWLDCEGDRS